MGYGKDSSQSGSFDRTRDEMCISNKVALQLSSCIHVFRNEAEFLQ